MPKLSQTAVPTYRLHKQSGLAVVTLNGRDITLGKHGTKQSREKYNRRIAEWLAAGRALPVETTQITVAEILNAYRKHAATYYRNAAGMPTGESARIKRELSPLLKLYSRLPAAELSPLKLKAVRESMLAAGWVRTSINHAVGTIRRMIRWATEQEMIPADVLHGLQAVAGLKHGRSEAKESAPIGPVAIEHVNAVLPLVSPQVKAMIELQLLTGMRSGEICIMRTGDIDRSGKLWGYTPAHHKTEHHGHVREVYLGPKAQQLLAPFLKLAPEACIFSPAEAEVERRERRHAQRKTPMSCGNRPGTNRKRRRQRCPGDRYDVSSYRRAIARACDAAFPPPPSIVTPVDLAKWKQAHRWHPHQLRHTAATSLRKTHGLEAAQIILGHRTLTVTQIYAEKNVEAAQRIMAAVG